MQIRTGVSGLPSFRLSCLPISSLNTSVLSSGWEKLLSASSFSSGLFFCEQVRMLQYSLLCSALCARGGFVVSEWLQHHSQCCFIYLLSERQRNKLCVSAYLFFRAHPGERNQWLDLFFEASTLKHGVWSLTLCACVCVCLRMVQHCHSSSLSKSTIIWSPPGGKCTPLISLE